MSKNLDSVAQVKVVCMLEFIKATFLLLQVHPATLIVPQRSLS